MRTNDRRLRCAVFTLPVFLSACGGASGAPGQLRTPPDGGPTGPVVVDPGPALQKTEGWSVHRRMRSASGVDVVLEEQLTSFTVAAPGATRIRRLDGSGAGPWNAPSGLFIEDAALHPSGQVSAVLINASFEVWLARLSPGLELLDLRQLTDPDIAQDPFPPATGLPAPTELTVNSLPRDSVRAAADGEDVAVVAMTPLESVILYRIGFSSSAWEAPRRALVLPVRHPCWLLSPSAEPKVCHAALR